MEDVEDRKLFYYFISRIAGLYAAENNWQTLGTKQLNHNIVWYWATNLGRCKPDKN